MAEEFKALNAKCKVCGKLRGMHQTKTDMCPRGLKTRIGYTSFGPSVFVLKPSSKKELEAESKQFTI